MIFKLLAGLLVSSTVYASTEKPPESKEEPKQEKKAEKADVHEPLSRFFLDRRPYMAPKKK